MECKCGAQPYNNNKKKLHLHIAIPRRIARALAPDILFTQIRDGSAQRKMRKDQHQIFQYVGGKASGWRLVVMMWHTVRKVIENRMHQDATDQVEQKRSPEADVHVIACERHQVREGQHGPAEQCEHSEYEAEHVDAGEAGHLGDNDDEHAYEYGDQVHDIVPDESRCPKQRHREAAHELQMLGAADAFLCDCDCG